MPSARPSLSVADVVALSETLFQSCGQDLVGVELEWPLHRRQAAEMRPDYADLAALDGTTLGHGSRVTLEPGGQIELSTAPFPSVSAALHAARTDARALFDAVDRADFVPLTLAVDDRRRPHRILDKPRYRAMEEFFSQQGWAGAWMMTNTTSTQINLGHDAADPLARWELLHRIAPILIAAFSNSPGVDLEGRRWACLRQAIWWSIDPARTRPVCLDGDPVQAWTEYALQAQVMFIAASDSDGSDFVSAPGLTFREWVTSGHPTGWPTPADLQTHMSTLFPPVRPRGWLELRVLDALPEWIREVAVLCVATAARADVCRELRRRLPRTGGLWTGAIRDGLADPCLDTLSRTFFEVVAAHVDHQEASAELIERLAEFRLRYVARRRCPGDDRAAPFDLRTPGLVAAGAA